MSPPRSALIVVDVQNDFITGSLALSQSPAGEDGAQVVPAINHLLGSRHFNFVVFTQDCHPPDHVSFTKWPVHCVADTWGAQLHADLNQSPECCEQILHIKKGVEVKVDSYSAFWNNDHTVESELREKLKAAHIETVLVVGLALDICVYYTALDAAEAGFKTYIVSDCCRAINPSDSTEMHEIMQTLKTADVQLITSNELSTVLM